MTKFLNTIPYRHITPFSNPNINNTFYVLRKLNPRKYKYNEYITTIVDAFFSHVNTITRWE